MKETKASIVTMIKAASSRAILLIFSSFLPAWAVGVVCDTAFVITFVDDITMSVVFCCGDIVPAIKARAFFNVLTYAPRQRQGKQSEEG